MADVTSIYGNPIKDAVARTDISTLQTDVQDVKDGLSDLETQIAATLITDTASGSIASFPDGADNVPVKSLTVDIEPVQDLHGQSNPYPAGGGKNLLVYPFIQNQGSANGITFVTNSDGSVTANGTATAQAVYTIQARNDLPYGTYVLSGGKSTSSYFGLGYFASDSATTETRINNTSESGTLFTAYKGFVTYIQLVISKDHVCNNEVFYPMIRLSSVSDATFAPYSNICPISGHTSAVVKRCGKNIANELHHGNITGDGVYGTGDTRVTNATSATSSIIKITAGQYTLSAQGLDYCTALTKDNSGNIVDNFASAWHSLPYTFTVTAEAWLYFTCRRSDNASITLADVAVQIEKGSATAYEPYQSQTVTIDLDGTRYGGTLNATTGVLTVTHAFYTINGQYTINKHATAFDAYYMELSRNGLPRCASTQDGTVGQFNMFRIGKLSDGNGCAFVGADTLQFRKDGGGTGAKMKAWLANNPLQVVYPLAAPQTVQLTAQDDITTVKGQNNIWNDCGDTTVEYRADTKLYINKMLNA